MEANNDLAKQAQQEMVDAVDGVQRALAAIDSAVDAAKAGWKGEAAGGFQTAAAEWNKKNDDLNRVLTAIEQQVGVGTAQFTAMDTSNNDDFGGLRLA
ncbi:WXG100 family type VII secretion target [Nocardia higoensis]|uniref:WXG100 family type VII secretion target n=1 Tax=Nocardia higoensis TaxID=228599 RepID=A0ABS0DEY2_9NOCA|nr:MULTISPECIES: WXG100 family type VII secretion target [Nocardia]MBF6356162.1 WXG100 family type VII secretion target [Nocardia higoensis]